MVTWEFCLNVKFSCEENKNTKGALNKSGSNKTVNFSHKIGV